MLLHRLKITIMGGGGVKRQTIRARVTKKLRILREINNVTECSKTGIYYKLRLPRILVIHVGLADGTRPRGGVYFSTVKSGS